MAAGAEESVKRDDEGEERVRAARAAWPHAMPEPARTAIAAA
jgi:hypothetical protein